jgi:hypothetical protein
MHPEAAVLLLCAKLGQRLGRYAGVRDFIAYASATNRGLHHFICRALSLAFGVADVAATYVSPVVHVDPRQGPAFRIHMVDCAPGQGETPHASYLITSDHARMPWFASVDPKLPRCLDGRPRPLNIFRAFRAGTFAKPSFYTGDAFFLPFTGRPAMERGGPVVTVWARP